MVTALRALGIEVEHDVGLRRDYGQWVVRRSIPIPSRPRLFVANSGTSLPVSDGHAWQPAWERFTWTVRRELPSAAGFRLAGRPTVWRPGDVRPRYGLSAGDHRGQRTLQEATCSFAATSPASF